MDAFVHHISDFTNAASDSGLKLLKLNEYWHETDENKPPRIVSFLFEKYTPADGDQKSYSIVIDSHPLMLYTVITPMGSSRPTFLGRAVVMTERNFPAA